MTNVAAGKTTVILTRNAYTGGFQSKELRDDDDQGGVVVSLKTTSVDEKIAMYGMTRLRLESTSVAFEGGVGVVDKVLAASISKTSLFWCGDRPICSPFIRNAPKVDIKVEKVNETKKSDEKKAVEKPPQPPALVEKKK